MLQRESDVEDPAPDDMYKVGTAARIIKILEMPNGNLTVILNGLEKVEITEYITTEPYFKARVTALRDSTPEDVYKRHPPPRPRGPSAPRGPS